MLDTRNPVLVGVYNGISFGLYKFLWMYRTIGDIRRLGQEKGISISLGHAKPLLILYAAIAALVPLITAYLLTVEVVPPNGGEHYYGLLSERMAWWLKKTWQIPALVLVFSLITEFRKVIPDGMVPQPNIPMLYLLGLGGVLIGWLTMFFVDSPFLFQLLLMSLFIYQFQKEKLQVEGLTK